MTPIAATATVRFADDIWCIVGTGKVADGRVLCHLVSTTRTRAVRAGRMGSRRVPRRCSVPLDAEAIATALGRPRDWFNWNPALRGAFAKGEAARARGEAQGTCPYTDKRTPRGGLTWSRSFETAWFDGWRHAKEASAMHAQVTT